MDYGCNQISRFKYLEIGREDNFGCWMTKDNSGLWMLDFGLWKKILEYLSIQIQYSNSTFNISEKLAIRVRGICELGVRGC